MLLNEAAAGHTQTDTHDKHTTQQQQLNNKQSIICIARTARKFNSHLRRCDHA